MKKRTLGIVSLILGIIVVGMTLPSLLVRFLPVDSTSDTSSDISSDISTDTSSDTSSEVSEDSSSSIEEQESYDSYFSSIAIYFYSSEDLSHSTWSQTGGSTFSIGVFSAENSATVTFETKNYSGMTSMSAALAVTTAGRKISASTDSYFADFVLVCNDDFDNPISSIGSSTVSYSWTFPAVEISTFAIGL